MRAVFDEHSLFKYVLYSGVKVMYEILFTRSGEEYYRCRFVDGCLHISEKLSGDALPFPQHAVIITEDPVTLLFLKNKGYCCIGSDPEGDRFFDGAEFVITDPGDVSEDLIGRAYDHHFRRPHMIAETERILIRESTEEDYPAIAAMMWENEGQAFGCFPQGNTLSKEDYLSYIGMTYRFFGFGNWSICEKSTGRVIGWCGLNPLSFQDEGKSDAADITILRYHASAVGGEEDPFQDEDVELGYVMRQDMRGRGYAYEACGVILQYAQQELGIMKYCVRISTGNESSFRLAHKLGFED